VNNLPVKKWRSYAIMVIVTSFNMKNLLLWTINRYGLWQWDVVSRSCKYQLEGYWQQSLHQLGKMDIFPKSGLCLFIYYLTSGLIIILLIVVIWSIFTQRTRSLDSGSLYKVRMHGKTQGRNKYGRLTKEVVI
jgi:hypothetical protein